MKRIHLSSYLLFFIMIIVTACSNDDYINSIPSDSRAVLSIDASKIIGKENISYLKDVMKINDLHKTGIDFSSRVFLFEDINGYFGLSAKIDNHDDLENYLKELRRKNIAEKSFAYKDYQFTSINSQWLIGFSDKSILILGPFTISEKYSARNLIAKYLSQDEDEGIKKSKTFQRLDSLKSSICFVGQLDVLPEKVATPFMLGAPRDADASQIWLSAEISRENDVAYISGDSYSNNVKINKSLKAARKLFHPITNKYVDHIPLHNGEIGLFANVEGNDFLSLMQQNKSLQMLLAGINSAIDINCIIKNMDGDFAIVLPYTDKMDKFEMIVKQKDVQWLNDVDYWKKSCPKGTRILEVGKNQFIFANGSSQIPFGVNDMQFYCGNKFKNILYNKKVNLTSLNKSKIEGSRILLLARLNSDMRNLNENKFLFPFLSTVKTIVFTMK